MQTTQERPRRKAHVVTKLLCIALIALSVLSLLFLPAIRLTGAGAAQYLTGLDGQMTESLETARDVLLHDETFDREAILAAGVDLAEQSVLPLLDRAAAVAARITNGSLSPLDLLRTSTLVQRLLSIAERLFTTEATAGLFDSLGIAEHYLSGKAAFALYRQYASLALIGYEALLGLIVLCAVGSILLTLFRKGRVFDVLLLIAECLLTLLLVGIVVGGNLLSAKIGLPVSVRLAFTFFPLGSLAATVAALILKARMRRPY